MSKDTVTVTLSRELAAAVTHAVERVSASENITPYFARCLAAAQPRLRAALSTTEPSERTDHAD